MSSVCLQRRNDLKIITITPAELLNIGLSATMRRVSALKKSRSPEHGIKPDREWQSDIEGMIGEYVLAKYLDVFWTPTVGALDSDIGDVKEWQVRTTAWKTGSLIVNKKDHDSHKFMLITGNNTVGFDWTVRGWLYGHEAKKDKYWVDKQTGRFAYFVPQSDLRLEDDADLV
tara:strand:- start:43 stop:558 length:516 start_codon:yes stop_codon:yes gene_type:complete